MSSAAYDDDFEEFDEFDADDDDDNTLSGLTVLLMGIVVLGAIATVAAISYHYGTQKTDRLAGNQPYISADPEPIKIENAAVAAGADNIDREVFDRFDGAASDAVETIAAGPEEPIDRQADDPISAIVAESTGANPVVDDAVADRIAALAQADAELRQDNGNVETPSVKPAQRQATSPTPASATPERTSGANLPTVSSPAGTSAASATSGMNALSGTHLVQVGAFRSDDEAMSTWARLKGRLGDFSNGKAPDVERADLGEKGIYYRLRIGPFGNKSDAVSYCEGLKSRGQDCLVKAK